MPEIYSNLDGWHIEGVENTDRIEIRPAEIRINSTALTATPPSGTLSVFYDETNGFNFVDGNGTAVTLIGMRVPDGSAAAPGLAFTGNGSAGMFLNGDFPALAQDGVEILRVIQEGILINDSASGEGDPAYSFILDPDTGIFRQAANTLSFSTGGTEAFRITSTNLLQGLDGADANPTYTFINDPDTGMFSQGGDELGFAIGGNEGARLSEPADGDTALLIRRNVTGTLTLQQVSMGAADSGGVGFKLLRVPN